MTPELDRELRALKVAEAAQHGTTLSALSLDMLVAVEKSRAILAAFDEKLLDGTFEAIRLRRAEDQRPGGAANPDNFVVTSRPASGRVLHPVSPDTGRLPDVPQLGERAVSPAAEPFEGDSEEELREYLGDAWTPSAMAEIEYGLLKWDANGFWAASVAANKHDSDPWEFARWFMGRYGGGMMDVRAAAYMLRYEVIWAFVSALEAALRDANLIRRDASGKVRFRPWFTEALCEQPYARRVRLTAMTTKGPDGEDYVGAFDPRTLMEVVTQKVQQRQERKRPQKPRSQS